VYIKKLFEHDVFKHRKLLLSVLSGVLGFVFSQFGIHIQWDTIVVNLSWSVVFPMLIALFYGWPYAIIASVSGGALYPFWLWANNGWANLATSLVYTIIYAFTGYLGKLDEAISIPERMKKYLQVLVFMVALLLIYYRFIFGFILALNPPISASDTISYLPTEILFGFFFKDVIQFTSFLLIVITLSHLPVLRKIYGLNELPESKRNHLIFALTILGAGSIWLIFVGLGYSLLRGDNVLRPEHLTLALHVFFVSGFVVALILMNYSELQLRVRMLLNTSQQMFRNSIEYNPVPIMITNKLGEVIHINRQFHLKFGFGENDIKSIEDWFHATNPDSEFQQIARTKWHEYINGNIANNQVSPSIEFGILCKNGKKKYVEISMFTDSDLNIISIQDITWRIENEIVLKSTVTIAEESKLSLQIKNQEYEQINEELSEINLKLREAKVIAEENNQLKTAFLQNLSHEIRTPLNAIIGFSEFLDDPGLTSERRKHFVRIIQSSSNRLLDTITDIITYSAIEKNQVKIFKEKIYVRDIISEVAHKFEGIAREKRMDLFVKHDLDYINMGLYTDKGKLLQIFNHLLANAFKFTKTGYIEFGYQISEHEIQFFVKDTGIGIPKSMFSNIFEPFRQGDKNIQVNYGGTGLGLAIVKAYIDMLGGRIWLESEINKETIFYFTVPHQ